jgi:hypothetical protein
MFQNKFLRSPSNSSHKDICCFALSRYITIINSKGIWVTSNGFNKQGVTKSCETGDCNLLLFKNCSYNVKFPQVSVLERQVAKFRKDTVSHPVMHEFCLISKPDAYVKAKFTTGLRMYKQNSALNAKQCWALWELLTHFWVMTAGASSGFSQMSNTVFIWTCVDTLSLWGSCEFRLLKWRRQGQLMFRLQVIIVLDILLQHT